MRLIVEKKIILFIDKVKFCLYLLSLFSVEVSFCQKNEPKNVLFFLYNGIEILDFTGPMEVLAASGYKIYTVADRDTVISRRILKIIPDYNFTKTKNFPKPDIVAVFGGSAHMLWEQPKYQAFLREITKETQINFSVCDGAFWFGGIGLLDNKTSTTFHWLISELQKDFPKTKTLEKVKYVDNGNLITSAGVSAGIDAAFYLVSKLKGNAFAQQVAERIEYDHWKPGTGKIIENTLTVSLKKDSFDEEKIRKSEIYKGELMNLCEWYIENNRIIEAEDCIRYIIKNYNPNEHDYSYLAQVLQKKEISSAPLTKQQFLHLIQQGDIGEAKKQYLTTQKKHPDWVYLQQDDLLFEGYYNFQNKGLYDKAIQIYELNLLMFPNYHQCLAYIAEVHALKNDIAKAISYFEKVIEKLPNDTESAYFKNRIKELRK